MARAKTAAKSAKDEAKSEQTALAMMDNDALADVLGDVELDTDGLEEIDSDDIRLAALIWNFKGTDKDDEPIAANRFFNTVTEEVTAEEDLALLTLHKSNAWKEFDESQNRNVVRCSSWDREVGTLESGETRGCKDCPDKRWARDPETGKRGRRCADVANVVGLRTKDGQPILLRFTRTSERPWKDFLNKHILGKRIVGGKRMNMPLFSHPSTLSLTMAKGAKGTYAVPVIERGESPFTREQILYFAESAKGFREMYLDQVREVAEGAPDDEGGTGGGGDSSFNPDDFSEGDDFVDTTGTETGASADRF